MAADAGPGGVTPGGPEGEGLAAGTGPAPYEPESPHGHPAQNPFAGVDPELVAQSIASTMVVPPVPATGLARGWQFLRTEWLPRRVPLLAVTLFLTLVALPRTTASVVSVLESHNVAGTIALLLWAAYAFPLVWLVTRFDFFEQEPWTLLASSMAWGGLIATGLALQANQAIYSMLTSGFGQRFSQVWGPTIAAPFTEETLKAIGIVWAILLARRRIRSAVDGFIVGAMVGVGFQVVENFIYTGNLLVSRQVESDEVSSVLTVFFVRGIASGLWSHAAYSGLVGIGIGFAFTRLELSRTRRVAGALGMYVIAMLLHAMWNSPLALVLEGPVSFLLKGSLIVGLLLFAIFRLQGRDSSIYTDYLEALDDPKMATEAEIADLRTSRTREAAVMRAQEQGGADAGEAVRQLQRAQADLSVALATGDLAEAAAGRTAVAEARQQIAALALLPRKGGHEWGVASIWFSVIGVLVPVVGALLAGVLAAVGTVRTRRSGLELDSSLRAAWVLAGISLVVGIVLWLLLGQRSVFS